jgi:LuxR family maltose regulon positive regulatory protein
LPTRSPRSGPAIFGSTEGETREQLAASGISLSAAGATALYERTEGWAAGLRLAVISLSGHPDPERFVAEFSGTDRAIGEYLMAEMLEPQPSEVQSMLLRTSLVDRVNGELGDLLAGRSGLEQMLLELEDANAFVVSLDAQRTWFRYHQLLADFLRLELRRTLADEVPGLHRRAAQWFADHGEVVEAVRHTQAAGDWPDAARLLADYLFSLTLDGQEGAIAVLLRSFPGGASADHPELALAHAAVQLAQGRLEEAAAQLALAESDVRGAPPLRRRRLAVAIASLRVALARRSGQFTEVIEQVKLLDASIADESSEPVAMSSELRGVALMNSRDRRDVVSAIRRCRAPPFRGRRARPGDRPALPRGRVSRSPGIPDNGCLARERARTGASGGRPGRTLWLGRSADTRAGAWGGCLLGDLDGRVRRRRERAAPRLGGRRDTN